MTWIRIKEISKAPITPKQKIDLMATAMEELALAEALRIIHGDRWPSRYTEMGGHVRFDDENEPVIWFNG
jgi:hypothetical protein